MKENKGKDYYFQKIDNYSNPILIKSKEKKY